LNPHEEKDSKNHEEKDSKNHEEKDSKNLEEKDSKKHEEKDCKNHEEKDSKNHEEKESKNQQEEEELKKKAKPEMDQSIMEARVRKLAESLRQLHTEQAPWISSEENMADLLEVEVDMDMEYLKKSFPDISHESLKEVYFINCGDLEDTIDMLSQLEVFFYTLKFVVLCSLFLFG